MKGSGKKGRSQLFRGHCWSSDTSTKDCKGPGFSVLLVGYRSAAFAALLRAAIIRGLCNVDPSSLHWLDYISGVVQVLLCHNMIDVYKSRDKVNKWFWSLWHQDRRRCSPERIF